jgi:hypothetical protein
MSNEENFKKIIETAKVMAGNLVSSMMELKEKNPKVFFGAVGGVVFLLILMMISGDESKPLSKYSPKNLVAGQRYVLKNPNALEEGATIRLVAMPGAIAAYDDAEEDDKSGSPCKHLKEGTAVTIVDFQDAYGKKDAFAKVKIEDGECQGHEGWVLSIDVQ